MQDIVFYVAANETLGLVRDYANMHRTDAPVLTIGVAACLRMRLFADVEVSTPYPATSFSSITDWRWSMDADFNRSTACKLVADVGGISVHTVTDTVNDETRSFTEIVIPISNMNTQELAAWLGNDGTKTGLTGELVGYDNNGNAVFVLQVENFTVRNRVAGLCDPTAVDEGIVTRSVAEQMIQTAVSSSAATKQDKLTSSNGGTGITVTSSGIISVSDVPQSAVTGLSASLAGKQDKLTSSNGGTGISVTGTGIISVSDVPQSAVTGLSASLAGKQNALTFGFGLDLDYLDDVLSLARYRTINVPTGATVTIVPGEAYKINATVSAKTINAASLPDNTWGLEGHLEIFVAGTGYVQTGENVVLANALEPDAVNNCTVRFHDGLAIISVEDHVAGYIVTINAMSGYGSLNNALSVDSREYIAVDASLNGQTLDLGGVTTYAGEKHVVGNGYTETVVSGGINCTSKTTFSNLGMDGVVVSSGTLTMGDVYIPNGATVSNSGGGLAVEKVSGNGGVIDLGGTVVKNNSVSLSGCTVTSGYYSLTDQKAGGVFANSTSVDAHDCVFSGNFNVSYTGGIAYFGYSPYSFTSCTFTSNSTSAGYFNAFYGYGSAYPLVLSNCVFGENQDIGLRGGARVEINGTFKTKSTIGPYSYSDNGTVTISSRAIIDLTGNTNATPIAPGGGVTFAPGGATVYPSAGSASAYILGGMKVPNIGNTNVVNLSGGRVTGITSDAYASNCIFSGGTAAFVLGNPIQGITLDKCTVSGNAAAGTSAGFWLESGTRLNLSSSVVSGNSVTYDIYGAGTVSVEASTIGHAQILTSGSINFAGVNKIDLVAGVGSATISSGAIIDLTGNSNSTPIAPGGGVVVDSGCTVINSAGSSVSITGGTYTKINNDGTTE